MEALGYLDVIYQNIINYILVYTRIISLFYGFTILRKQMVTSKILLSLTAVLSFYVLIILKLPKFNVEMVSISFFLHSIVQVLLGIFGAIILNVVFEIFTGIGQLISTQIGLAAASLFDPKFGMITSLTNFYILSATMLFFMMNGHLALFKIIITSFDYVPVSVTIFNFKGNIIFNYASIIFRGAVLICITLIAAIMMTNICLAVMSKFAPQFNLFSVGLNMSLMIGLICIYLTFDSVISHGNDYITNGLLLLRQYYQGIAS
jgi:flagellar biosynthetic protein FliR